MSIFNTPEHMFLRCQMEKKNHMCSLIYFSHSDIFPHRLIDTISESCRNMFQSVHINLPIEKEKKKKKKKEKREREKERKW